MEQMAILKSRKGGKAKGSPRVLRKGSGCPDSQEEQGKDQATTGLDLSDDPIKPLGDSPHSHRK